MRRAAGSWPAGFREDDRHQGMIRFLTRSLFRLVAAVFLLALGVCAVEVALRGWELRTQLRTGLSCSDDIVIPSATSWIDVKPLLDVVRTGSAGQQVRLVTNEHGLRNGSTTIPKPRGVFRVLCLGGDHVFGPDLDAGETMPGKLQRYLEMQSSLPVEVLNAGCPRAGPLVNLLRYRDHLAVLQPDLVLLCLTPEDIRGDDDVRGALFLDEARNPAYAAHPALADQGCNVVDGACREFVTVQWVMRWAGDALGLPSQATSNRSRGPTDRSPHELAPLVPLQQLVSANLGRLVVSLSPSAWSLDQTRRTGRSDNVTLAEEVAQFLSQVRMGESIPVLDAATSFSQHADVRPLLDSRTGFLSSQGQDLYAQQLSRFVSQLVPDLNRPANWPAAPAASPSPAVPSDAIPPPIPITSGSGPRAMPESPGRRPF